MVDAAQGPWRGISGDNPCVDFNTAKLCASKQDTDVVANLSRNAALQFAGTDGQPANEADAR